MVQVLTLETSEMSAIFFSRPKQLNLVPRSSYSRSQSPSFLGHVVEKRVVLDATVTSVRSADVFPVVASLPPKIAKAKAIFGGREATTENTSALRRLQMAMRKNKG